MILTPWSRVLPEKLIVAQLVKKFPLFINHVHRNSSIGPCPEQDESITPYSIEIRFNIILPTTPYAFGQILYALIISPMLATCAAYLALIDLVTLIMLGEAYRF
jgi:hypothetical protein